MAIDPHLTTGQVAKTLGIRTDKARLLQMDGTLKSYEQAGVVGSYMTHRNDLRKYMTERGYPVPSWLAAGKRAILYRFDCDETRCAEETLPDWELRPMASDLRVGATLVTWEPAAIIVLCYYVPDVQDLCDDFNLKAPLRVRVGEPSDLGDNSWDIVAPTIATACQLLAQKYADQ